MILLPLKDPGAIDIVTGYLDEIQILREFVTITVPTGGY
jgi:hypothetical protein